MPETQACFEGEPSELISFPVAAELVPYSVRSLKRLVDDGDLQAWRIGRSVRVRRSDVLALIQPAGAPLDERIKRLVDQAPPLTPEQADNLSRILSRAAVAA